MSDLISRKALLKVIRDDRLTNASDAIYFITNAPAIEKGEAEEYDDEREEIASEHLDDVIAWLKYRGLYDEIDYLNEGPDFSEILTNHEKELIQQYASSQQPQSVADALEDAAKICDDYANSNFGSLVDSGQNGAYVCSKAIRALIKRNEVNHG